MLTAAVPSIHPPPERSYHCCSCNHVVTPTHDWKCTNCRSGMRYGCRSAPCPHCGNTVMWVRKGNLDSPQCQCQETAEERTRRLNHERRVELAERQRLAKEEELKAIERAKAQGKKMKAAASRCWTDEKKHSCQVTKTELDSGNAPRAYCSKCPKWGK